MIPPMAFTQSDVDALDAAIKGGELTVSIDGRSVTYRSLDDLLKARSIMLAEINRASTRTGPRHVLADFSDD